MRLQILMKNNCFLRKDAIDIMREKAIEGLRRVLWEISKSTMVMGL